MQIALTAAIVLHFYAPFALFFLQPQGHVCVGGGREDVQINVGKSLLSCFSFLLADFLGVNPTGQGGVEK